MSAIGSTDDSLVGLRGLMLSLRRVIEEQTGLVCSSHIIDHTGNTAASMMNDTFSLELQTANAEQYREDVALRLRHALGVTLCWKLNPSDAFESQQACLAVEEQVIRALSERIATAEVRVVFENTARTLSAHREYLLSRLTFRVEHDWYSQPLSSAYA